MGDPKKIDINQYLLFFLQGKSYEHELPGIHFWAITLLIIQNDVIITMKDGHALTPRGLYQGNGGLFKT